MVHQHAMHAEHNIVLPVLSVCLSSAGIMSKRMHILKSMDIYTTAGHRVWLGIVVVGCNTCDQQVAGLTASHRIARQL